MVGHDRIIVDAIAFFQNVSVFAIVDFENAFQYVDELFPFVSRQDKIDTFFCRRNVDQERLHVASGFILRQGVIFHVLACFAVVIAEADTVRIVAVFFTANNRTEFGLIVQECTQADAQYAGYLD